MGGLWIVMLCEFLTSALTQRMKATRAAPLYFPRDHGGLVGFAGCGARPPHVILCRWAVLGSALAYGE